MLFIQPAYNRVYKTVESCLADWNAGKDFKIVRGPYLSNRDVALLKQNGYTQLTILWDQKNKTTIPL